MLFTVRRHSRHTHCPQALSLFTVTSTVHRHILCLQALPLSQFVQAHPLSTGTSSFYRHSHCPSFYRHIHCPQAHPLSTGTCGGTGDRRDFPGRVRAAHTPNYDPGFPALRLCVPEFSTGIRRCTPSTFIVPLCVYACITSV